MSKGTRYTQQSYKVSDAFPFEWIKKKWKENFYITSMATAGTNTSCTSCWCNIPGIAIRVRGGEDSSDEGL